MKSIVLACIWLTVACGSDDDKVAVNASGGAVGGTATIVNIGAVGGAAATANGGSGAGAPATGTSSNTRPTASLGKIGSACTVDVECPAGGSGTPVCLTDWPSGYCAVDACADHGHDCPDDPGNGSTSTTGGKCVLAPTARCLALCATDADCRTGYSCASKGDAAGHGNVNVCVPSLTGAAAQGGAANDASMGSSGSSANGNGSMEESGSSNSGDMMMGSGSTGTGMAGSPGTSTGSGSAGAGGSSSAQNMNTAAGMGGADTHVHSSSADTGGTSASDATGDNGGMAAAGMSGSDAQMPSTGGMSNSGQM